MKCYLCGKETKYCPYCQNEAGDDAGCCHESSGHMITLEEIKEYDPQWYQEIQEYEKSQELMEAYQI